MKSEYKIGSACSAGCGFYGNAATLGLCSLCYKKNYPMTIRKVPAIVNANNTGVKDETEAKKNTSDANEARVSKNEKDADYIEEVKVASSLEDAKETKETVDTKKKSSRCDECRRKVGLTAIQCRCGGIYCGLHRYSDMHACNYDYHEEAKKVIRHNNPLTKGEKIQKI